MTLKCQPITEFSFGKSELEIERKTNSSTPVRASATIIFFKLIRAPMKTTQVTALTVVLSLSALLFACTDSANDKATSAETKTEATAKSESKSVDFTKTDVKVGTGADAKQGQNVSVHYTGWLFDPSATDQHGSKFDSSRDRGQPFVFPLGAGRVIKGWDQGVVGMKEGGQRTLIIPSDMAYGARGAGNAIPPNATLIFDVELIKAQ